MKIDYMNILDTSSDIQEEVRLLRNHDAVRKYMYTDHCISHEEHSLWLSSLQSSRESRLVWVVLDADKAIGLVSLSNISLAHKTADWAFYLSPDLRGKGVGVQIEYWLLEKAFNEMNLIKLNCEVLLFNQSVIKLHKKFGFVEEGIRRSNIKKDAERVDVVMLGIIKDEWLEKRRKMTRILSRLG